MLFFRKKGPFHPSELTATGNPRMSEIARGMSLFKKMN